MYVGRKEFKEFNNKIDYWYYYEFNLIYSKTAPITKPTIKAIKVIFQNFLLFKNFIKNNI
jgi:hypothetical protein